MEKVFQYISSHFVTVDKGRIRSTNEDVHKVVTKVTAEMKSVSPLFRTMFETHLFAGSAFDGLKVGKPDEFDIDFKLFIPRKLNVQVIPSDKPGFVYLYLKGWRNLKKDHNLNMKYGELENFMTDSHYLSQRLIKNWMESIVSRAIRKLEENGEFRRDLGNIRMSYRMTGPAVTLKIHTNDNKDISIDLVAVIRIPGEKWPEPPVRQNISRKKKHYLVVPKAPKVPDPNDLDEDLEIYWRLSFPEQEMEYLNNYYTLKPVLRFIKKLRDKHHPNIPSYFIKTIFLWEVRYEPANDKSYWQRPFVDVFIDMLEIYRDYMDVHNISYFWNSSHNLLEPYDEDNTANIRDFLDGMIDDLENSDDPYILARYLLPEEEYEKFFRGFPGH